MNTDVYRRFRKGFSDQQWEKLNSHIEFKEAMTADDLDKAGELAGRILIGETKSLKEAREMKKMHDTFGEFLD